MNQNVPYAKLPLELAHDLKNTEEKSRKLYQVCSKFIEPIKHCDAEKLKNNLDEFNKLLDYTPSNEKLSFDDAEHGLPPKYRKISSINHFNNMAIYETQNTDYYAFNKRYISICYPNNKKVTIETYKNKITNILFSNNFQSKNFMNNDFPAEMNYYVSNSVDEVLLYCFNYGYGLDCYKKNGVGRALINSTKQSVNTSTWRVYENGKRVNNSYILNKQKIETQTQFINIIKNICDKKRNPSIEH